MSQQTTTTVPCAGLAASPPPSQVLWDAACPEKRDAICSLLYGDIFQTMAYCARIARNETDPPSWSVAVEPDHAVVAAELAKVKAARQTTPPGPAASPVSPPPPSSQIEYTWGDGQTKYVDAAAAGLACVGDLRDYIAEARGLPPSERLRLKCGARDLRDNQPLSDVDETVHVMLVLRGGAPHVVKRRRGAEEDEDESDQDGEEEDDDYQEPADAEDGDDDYQEPADAEDGEEEAEMHLTPSHDWVPGGTSQAAAIEKDEEEKVVEEQIELRPFQKAIVEIVKGEAGDRAIYWIYSLQGEYGKTRLATYLKNQFGALILNPDAAKDSMKVIRKQLNDTEKFEEKPVLVIDLVRSKSTSTKKLYATLEEVQNLAGNWPAAPPHIFVFANNTPDTDRLSADRLRVYLITKEHELVPAKHVQKELDAYDEHLAKLQEQEEEAARTGVKRAAGPRRAPHEDGHLAERIEAVKRVYQRVKKPSPLYHRTRLQCFEQLAKRETRVWELWGNETDRANALKKKGCNLRPDSSFLLVWDAAFKGALGDDFAFTEPSRGNADPEQRPWHTDQLKELR